MNWPYVEHNRFGLISLTSIQTLSIFQARKAGNEGRKRREADNYHEAETMALTSISFGLCAVLTILICIPQLKRGFVYD